VRKGIIRGIVIALLVLALLTAGFVSGAVYTVRTARAAEQTRIGPKSIPWNTCFVCYELYPAWLCWLSGCP
jgi:hypothetical protein